MYSYTILHTQMNLYGYISGFIKKTNMIMGIKETNILKTVKKQNLLNHCHTSLLNNAIK